MKALIDAYAKEVEMEVEVVQTAELIALIFQEGDTKIESFLLGLDARLPASLYLGKSKHYFSQTKPPYVAITPFEVPLNISLCPSCQKEMFDVSSRRYYYPFTSCRACGGQHPFVTSYPYERKNSTMKFLVPCASCQEELEKNPLRASYPLISCIECGITVKMNDKKSERYANDKGSYRKLFEVSAGALKKGKSVLMKTLNGYRKFYAPSADVVSSETMVLMNDANALNKHMMMVTQEFNALLSIERPIVRVSTKSDEMKAYFGSTALLKYPDDGMTMLLARECMNAGLSYLFFEEASSQSEADFLVDFDIPIQTQKDTKIFINQDRHFFITGERIVYPAKVATYKEVVSVAHGLAGVQQGDGILIDTLSRFSTMDTPQVNVLQGEPFQSGHSNERHFEGYQSAMLSILAEHQQLQKKAVGIHFDSSLYFLYYNAKEVINVVPPNPFDATNMFEHIATLREGSDRLVENYQKAYPKLSQRLSTLGEDADLFRVTAMMLGLKDESFEGISAEALSFLGKGGIQIDTRVENNRFDNYAFLASIMSYQLGGVESTLIAYSIYESFGDYIGEIISQLMEKTGAVTITLSGETFANQALYARIERHLGRRTLLYPKNYPIGCESDVHGGIFL